MIAALRFGAPQERSGRFFRSLGFALRSTLPISAICLTANGVCEQMKRLLDHDFQVEVLEPIILVRAGREAIFADALAYRVSGKLCDVFIIVRQVDAGYLSATAFREKERPENIPLSEVEKATLDRIFSAIAPLCVPLCGDIRAVHAEQAMRAQTECMTYFEVRTVGTPSVSIGFALTKDPPEESTRYLQISDILDVKLEARVECARGEMPFSSLSSLDVASTVALRTSVSEGGRLFFGDVVFSGGSCGVQNGRSAFIVGQT